MAERNAHVPFNTRQGTHDFALLVPNHDLGRRRRRVFGTGSELRPRPIIVEYQCRRDALAVGGHGCRLNAHAVAMERQSLHGAAGPDIPDEQMAGIQRIRDLQQVAAIELKHERQAHRRGQDAAEFRDAIRLSNQERPGRTAMVRSNLLQECGGRIRVAGRQFFAGQGLRFLGLIAGTLGRKLPLRGVLIRLPPGLGIVAIAGRPIAVGREGIALAAALHPQQCQQSDDRDDGDSHAATEQGEFRFLLHPATGAFDEPAAAGPNRFAFHPATQILRHRIRRHIAVRGILGDRLEADGFEIRGQVLPELLGARRGVVNRLMQHGGGRSFKRRATGEQLVQHDTQRILVGRGFRLAFESAGDLGRDVTGRAHHGPGPRQTRGIMRLRRIGLLLGQLELLGRIDLGRQTEVHQERLAQIVEHDVRRLHIAMDNTFLMRVRQPLRERTHDLRRLLQVDPAVVHDFAEWLAFDEGRSDVELASAVAGVVNGDDVRMPQLRRGTGFAQETLHPLRIVQHAALRHFDCDLALQLRIVGEVDRAERSGTEALPHLETSDHSDRPVGRCGSLVWAGGRGLHGGYRRRCRGRRIVFEHGQTDFARSIRGGLCLPRNKRRAASLALAGPAEHFFLDAVFLSTVGIRAMHENGHVRTSLSVTRNARV